MSGGRGGSIKEEEEIFLLGFRTAAENLGMVSSIISLESSQ
jgi:hypothetical protein